VQPYGHTGALRVRRCGAIVGWWRLARSGEASSLLDLGTLRSSEGKLDEAINWLQAPRATQPPAKQSNANTQTHKHVRSGGPRRMGFAPLGANGIDSRSMLCMARAQLHA
jgi:hypothetical protein